MTYDSEVITTRIYIRHPEDMPSHLEVNVYAFSKFKAEVSDDFIQGIVAQLEEEDSLVGRITKDMTVMTLEYYPLAHRLGEKVSPMLQELYTDLPEMVTQLGENGGVLQQMYERTIGKLDPKDSSLFLDYKNVIQSLYTPQDPFEIC